MIRYTITPSKNDRDGFYHYEDDYVRGVIYTYMKGLVGIYEWSSKHKEKGGTRKSLKNLRDLYGTISVHDIGLEGIHHSYYYWVKMKREGLVDDIYDDNAELVKEVLARVMKRVLGEAREQEKA